LPSSPTKGTEPLSESLRASPTANQTRPYRRHFSRCLPANWVPGWDSGTWRLTGFFKTFGSAAQSRSSERAHAGRQGSQDLRRFTDGCSPKLARARRRRARDRYAPSIATSIARSNYRPRERAMEGTGEGRPGTRHPAPGTRPPSNQYSEPPKRSLYPVPHRFRVSL